MRATRTIIAGLCAALFAAPTSARDLHTGAIELAGESTLSTASVIASADGSADTTTKSTSIDLRALYYLTSHIGVGVVASYDRDDAGSTGDQQQYAGPSFQFVAPIARQWSAKIRVEFAGGSGEAWTRTTSSAYDVRAAVAAVGLAYWIADAVSLDLQYEAGRFARDYTNAATRNTSARGDWLGVGFSVYLN